jgi:hypothetical protein
MEAFVPVKNNGWKPGFAEHQRFSFGYDCNYFLGLSRMVFSFLLLVLC